MTPKSKRLLRKEVEEVFKFGRFINSPNLVLRFIKNNNKLPAKVSVVVSKKVIKTAVGRNRLRRRGYIAVDRFLPHFPYGLVGVLMFGVKSNGVFGGLNKINKKESMKKLEEELEYITQRM